MDQLKTSKGIAYLTQCLSTGVPYSSLMRWRSRILSGRSPALKPGPKPIKSLDLKCLIQQISNLDHVRKRTCGTGTLYHQVSDRISRRDFQLLVTESRQNHKRNSRQSQCRIQWLIPGMTWAFDDMEYIDPGFNQKNYVNSMRDLASRYIFRPLTGFRQADGFCIARHLESLFEEHGPPLFLKRDNGGNLNHHAVNQVLSKWMVIPYNSPPYYPQYNGSIEQTQNELKTELKRVVCCTPRELILQAQIAANTLNHRPRPCIKGRISCQVLSDGKSKMKAFHKRKRKEVYEWLQTYAMLLANNGEKHRSFDSAWRDAIQIWLQEHGCISMINNEKCYPIFSNKIAHN
jgi:transposase InsO family protein